MTTLHEIAEAIREQAKRERVVTWRDHQRESGIAYWKALLAKHDNSVSAAASDAGVNRTTAYVVLRRLGLDGFVKPPHRGNWGET